jgi:hypothetical protein
MCAKKKEILIPVREKLVRKHKITFMLNDKEMEAIEKYLSRYRIKNKSRFYRETIIRHILKQMEEDSPELF